MKNKLIVGLLLVISFSYAQIPIGLKYDVNSVPFNGYYDALTYNPEKSIANVYTVENFDNGYYFTKAKKKIEGLISYDSNKIWFKKNEGAESIKIKANEIAGFVIGLDSFYCVSKYKNGNVLKRSIKLVQQIATTDNFVFLKSYHKYQGVFKADYSVKTKGTGEWEFFYNDYEFKNMALKYFKDIPYLEDKLKSKEYGFDDIMSLMKMTGYIESYNAKIPIYYDKYWQETKEKKRAVYFAKISAIKDSVWTLDYYKDKTKLYQGNYTSFYPNVKTGDFTAYYPDGSVRQITTYLDDKPKEVKSYRENGDLDKHYKYVERHTIKGAYQAIEYVTVNDASGKNIIDEYDRTAIVIHDAIDSLDYTNEYENYRLVSSYRLKGKDTIYKIVDRTYDIKLGSLQRKFNSFMEGKDFNTALSENAQGIIFVNVVLSPKGTVIKAVILNKVQIEFDQITSYFVKTKLLAKGNHFKFIAYKKGKNKQYSEFVIPIAFSINRYYHPSSANLHYFNRFMLDNMNMLMTPTIVIPIGL